MVCTNDITKFSASLVMDILRAHPRVIIGGIPGENLFYVPPDELARATQSKGRSADSAG
jgi:hypothetical protein